MKDKKLLYGIIISFIFLLSIGLTYAYFSVTTTVIGDRNDIKASVGELSILYTDGPEIVADNIQPGWTTTKTVKIKNTGTLRAFYSLDWASLTNEITNDELVLSATCTSDTGSCSNVDSMPVNGDEISIGVGINPGEEQTYVITFEFIETSSAQNYNQDKRFNGVLNVIESPEAFTLMGILTDSNGDPIEGATLEVHSTVRTGVTDETGTFKIKGVQVGNHEVNVKNLGNTTIATDSISLLSSNTEEVIGKQITGDTSKGSVNVKVKLGASDINNISLIVLSWYEKCLAGDTDIKCKLLSDNTEYADNVSSAYVSSATGVNFAAPSSNTNGKGLYYTTDVSKTENGERVYYFRGSVTNNYLIYGGYCWRIVRTVEDGNVKLRYGGIPTGGVCPQTGTDVSIARAQFNKLANDNAYVGYMYGAAGTGYRQTTHGYATESNIKKVIEAWYSGEATTDSECYNGTSYVNCDFTSLANKMVNNSSLIGDSIFCSDRAVGTGGVVDGTTYTEFGYGTNNTLYAAARRVHTNGPTGTSFGSTGASPSYKCEQDVDRFSSTLDGEGNGMLFYPVGLLTADEFSFAGLVMSDAAISMYLHIGESYWSMTPADYNGSSAYVFQYVRPMSTWGTMKAISNVSTTSRVVPVISVKPTANVTSGDGSYSSPYIIE